jgi:hypothetical protein
LIVRLEELRFSGVEGTPPSNAILINRTTFFLPIKALFFFARVLAFIRGSFKAFVAAFSFFFFLAFSLALTLSLLPAYATTCNALSAFNASFLAFLRVIATLLAFILALSSSASYSFCA